MTGSRRKNGRRGKRAGGGGRTVSLFPIAQRKGKEQQVSDLQL